MAVGYPKWTGKIEPGTNNLAPGRFDPCHVFQFLGGLSGPGRPGVIGPSEAEIQSVGFFFEAWCTFSG